MTCSDPSPAHLPPPRAQPFPLQAYRVTITQTCSPLYCHTAYHNHTLTRSLLHHSLTYEHSHMYTHSHLHTHILSNTLVG